MEIHEFGPASIAKLDDPVELKELLCNSYFKSETIVIKPNWVSTDPADFTDADSLRILFEALDSKIVVTESHSLARSLNLTENGMRFIADEKEVNWKWLLKGEGWNWLIQNQDWDWFIKSEHWNQIQKEEKEFLRKYGFSDLFKELNATYVNVTDEVWNGKVTDPDEIRMLVESRFRPVETEKLYNLVPRKLYDLRGSTFISFAKLKMYASFTVKNLFRMIPDPLRPYWHGPNNSRIARSIVDINKIYQMLFNVYGICEAFSPRGIRHPNGEFEGLYAGKYNIEESEMFVACCEDLFFLDALLIDLTDPSKRLIADINKEPIALAEQEFGAIDRSVFEDAKLLVGDWL